MPVKFTPQGRSGDAFERNAREVEERIQNLADQVALPALRERIRVVLGMTPNLHKKNNYGGWRTPQARMVGGRMEAPGSETERRAWVEAETVRAPGHNTAFQILAGSPTESQDGSVNLLNTLHFGRRGAGMVRKHVVFWGVKGGSEGPISASSFRHAPVRARDVYRAMLTPDVMRRLSEEWNRIALDYLRRAPRRPWRATYKAEVTLR